MSILDSLFGKKTPSTYVIDENKLKDVVKQTLPIRDEQQLERVVESIKSSLVPLTSDSFEKVGDIVSETLEDLYNIGGVNRIQLCKQVDEFIKANPEIANSVKLMSSYIAYGASDINIEDYKVILVADSEEIQEEAFKQLTKFEKESKIKRLIYILAQDLIKYEDAFLEKIRNKDGKVVSVKYLPSNTMLIKVDPVTGKPIKYYQVIDHQSVKYVDEHSIFDDAYKLKSERKVIEFEPEDIVHINNGSPVGLSDSPILSIAVLWRFLKLLEESLVIHRVTRAKRFIIFFLDVTGKTREAIRKAVSSFTAMLKRIFSIDTESGSVVSRNSIIQSATDLVIPITSDSKTRVQTIPTDTSATKIEDLKFYTNRLLTNFMTSWIFYPEKTGKEEIQKEAFIRLVKIYQKHFSYALTDLYREYLHDRGFGSSIDVRIQFPNPDTQAEVKVIDVVVRRMMIINQITAIIGVVPPIRWIVNYVFRDLSQVEIEELVSLIEQEIKKQEEKNKGQELPSMFEQATKSSQPESILDQIINLAEEYTDEDRQLFIQPEQLEKVTEKTITNVNTNTESKKSIATKLIDVRIKSVEQALEYLQIVNHS